MEGKLLGLSASKAVGSLIAQGAMSVTRPIKDRQLMVREFHAAFGFPIEVPLVGKAEATEVLNGLARELRIVHGHLQSKPGHDWRTMRAWLILEELAELCEAMRDGNYIEVADACGDLDYVVNGTAVTFGIPLAPVFNEIHRSNMTKTRGTELKPVKGDGYSPPDIQGAIDAVR